LVFDGASLYGIEAPATPGGEPAMFRLADVYFAPGELGCEISAATIDGEQAVAAMAQELTPLAVAGASHNLDLGAVADFEFSQAFGSNAEAALLTRFNNVDGIFSEQLGIQITVADVDIFTASDDPFTASGSNALLEELAQYRGATASRDALGLTHLFTGRDLDGGTAGIAFFGGVCATRPRGDTRSFGAGLSEARRGATLDSLVAAHEIGHSFGAPHDGDASGACASTPTTFLMAPSVSGSDRFSACSLEQMQNEIATASCLTPLGPTAARAVDLVWSAAGSIVVGLNGQTTVTATLSNTADLPASAMTATATFPSGLRPDQATLGGTACSISALTVTCPPSSLAARSTVDLVLAMTGVGGGNHVVTLGATATEPDRVPADNQSSFTVSVSVPSDPGGGGALSWLAVAALLAGFAWKNANGAGLACRRRSS
jgi:hypothetical protein